MECIRELAEIYPQLYLDPAIYSIEDYKSVVLRGGIPDKKELSHFIMDERDYIEQIATPAGEAKVVTLYNRQDFEIFMRCMMAAKEGPGKLIPATMGASTISCFNWPRINAHKEAWMKEQREAGVLFPDWPAEFRRFREVKENYIDMLIFLSRGPYSNISVEAVNSVTGTNVDRRSSVEYSADDSARRTADSAEESRLAHHPLSDTEWLEKSDAIRKYHELTHFVCRKLYPDKIDAIWDELVADAAGLYAAFGRFDSSCRQLEELFLGISDGRYTVGRLINYTKTTGAEENVEDMDAVACRISAVLRSFEEALTDTDRNTSDVFEVMLQLENMQDELWHK